MKRRYYGPREPHYFRGLSDMSQLRDLSTVPQHKLPERKASPPKPAPLSEEEIRALESQDLLAIVLGD